jgi:hypothetical protein
MRRASGGARMDVTESDQEGFNRLPGRPFETVGVLAASRVLRPGSSEVSHPGDQIPELQPSDAGESRHVHGWRNRRIQVRNTRRFITRASRGCGRDNLVRFDSVEQQTCQILLLRNENDLQYPLVLKPDVGQRGYGFKVIHSDEDIHSYVTCFKRDVLVQKYVPGPLEAGIFYYRFPQEREGRIFAITEKVFPVVTGDGRHTLEELIRTDSRASLLAETYLHRFASEKAMVLPAGESFRLVEAGNHCQGAIFLDGGRLLSATLQKRIDEISQSIPGFFVGRFDLRYSSEEALREGRDFQIIELNGASSEATNIYDPCNSLWNAYRTLFRQWEIVFAIADENRKRGLRTMSVGTILEKFLQYRKQAALHPVSD